MAHILIAEQNPSTTRYLTASLKKTGSSVATVDNCLDAWRTLSREAFDILIINVVMPGVDGFVLAQKALQDNPDLQVIFITGFAAVALDKAATPVYAPAPITTLPFHLSEVPRHVRYLMGLSSLPARSTAGAMGGSVVYANFGQREEQAHSSHHLA